MSLNLNYENPYLRKLRFKDMENRVSMPKISLYFVYAAMKQSRKLNSEFTDEEHYSFLASLWNSLDKNQREWYFDQEKEMKLEIAELKKCLKYPDKPDKNIKITKLWDIFLNTNKTMQNTGFIVQKIQVLKKHNVYCKIFHIGIISNIIVFLIHSIERAKTKLAKKCIILSLIDFFNFSLVKEMRNEHPEFNTLLSHLSIP